jgi:cobalt-zinc-cadmium efflux system protein
MRSVPGVTDVHHLHVWSLAPGDVAATAHVSVAEGTSVHDTQEQAHAIEALLAERFGITHVTVQVECHPCAAPDH